MSLHGCQRLGVKSKHNLAIAQAAKERSHFSISLVGVIQSDRTLFRTKSDHISTSEKT
ncbi:hypothetical protein H6F98_02170 [Microcoleus sp. FACHB-SPT15]|uniref:hypothetical protein n=1 Tax=Microcoleus sp. FACHB-SPT15 TaxID=2692830 RepID=UPI001780621D|nr:hypothetical protein [Microcoleus sp. FACHB-SPT15]MBD1804280.1 hypothetical protein [Microcoleus sp. FACHB-SPT15]